MDRRHFVNSLLATSIAAHSWNLARGSLASKPKVLLRSSWQTVNIGDIAHTPGVLTILEKYLPEAEVQLWPMRVDNGVEEMLRKRFPSLAIVQGNDAVARAMEECDFLLHGSGPSLVAQRDIEKWSSATGKPYGVYGITFSAQESSATRPTPNDALKKTLDVLSAAKFVFFRDSVSLELAKRMGCVCPTMEFGPDGAFAVDLEDAVSAKEFVRSNKLEEGEFVCCIPRLRFTPYWTIPEKKVAKDESKHARNEAMKEQDCKPLREAILTVLENSKLKVLLCPEDRTQMAVAKEMIYDALPDSAKSRVVWRQQYWLTDEAISTYRMSAGLFGHEMHSPIMCIGNGVPAIVCRWAEQTSKGLMWRDIGLDDWLFDFDQESERRKLAPAVLSMISDPAAAKSQVLRAQKIVTDRQKATMQILKKSLTG